MSHRQLTLRCIACDHTMQATLTYRCPDCGGILEVARQKPEERDWCRADFVSDAVTLGEGATQLRELRPGLLHADFQGQLFVKDETRNPSGSFKDRLVAAAMSRALDLDATGVDSASSGNAGVPAIVVCPEATPTASLPRFLPMAPNSSVCRGATVIPSGMQ